MLTYVLCFTGKPIFSVDIHPDGTKFATGGQGKTNTIIYILWFLMLHGLGCNAHLSFRVHIQSPVLDVVLDL